ncbi:DUF1272 domain-containing protein [Neptunomonas sp. XY-337]|uniref:DUF1272 domain-containing protein n=1 Tax=Neptunomonas sp. XY-337 TaxID=2561897 RepID=UPI0010A9CA8B|nr:DUF1272 domain-containing protein [Neptunomonas sp. XY-337]
MLELKPTCECCGEVLPPNSPKAVICAYECTFCLTCAREHLNHICPNHGSKLVERPSLPVSAMVSPLNGASSTSAV